MRGAKRRERLNEYIGTMRTTSPNGFVKDLEYCMTALGRMNQEEWHRTRTMLLGWVRAGRPMLEEPHAATIFAQIIQTGRARSEVAPEVDPDRTGNLLRDAYFGILYRWTQYEQPPGSLSEELLSVLHIILSGVLPRKDA